VRHGYLRMTAAALACAGLVAGLGSTESSAAKKKNRPSIAGTYKGTTQDGPPGPYPLAVTVSKKGVVTGLRTTLLIYDCDGVITRYVSVPVPIKMQRLTPYTYEAEWTGPDTDPDHRLKVQLKLDVLSRTLKGTLYTEDRTKFDPEQGFRCYGRTPFDLKGSKPKRKKGRS
jgi:hypothetical protein